MEKDLKFGCILWGGYAGGNVGDELTLAVALGDLQKRFGQSSVAILSPIPGYTRALFPDVEVIHYAPVRRAAQIRSLPVRVLNRIIRRPSPPERYTLEDQFLSEPGRQWAEPVGRSKLLYFVGGGYLTDLFDVDFFLLPARLARARGIPIETAPIGIGPFSSPCNLEKWRKAFEGACVRVRDEPSYKICLNAGVKSTVERDDGFRIRDIMAFSEEGYSHDNIIGINYYHQHGAIDPVGEVSWWKELLTRLQTENFAVEGFCFHNTLSSDFSQTVQLFVEAGLPTSCVMPPDFDFRNACRRLAKYRAIITARFHAAVVGGTLGLPTFAVVNGEYYSPKMDAACSGVKNSYAVTYKDTTPEQIVEKLRKLTA